MMIRSGFNTTRDAFNTPGYNPTEWEIEKKQFVEEFLGPTPKTSYRQILSTYMELGISR